MSSSRTRLPPIADLPTQLAGLSLLASLEGMRIASNLTFDIALNSLHYAASLTDEIDAVRAVPVDAPTRLC